MNILREVRRVNQKSMPVRIMSVLVFSVILIVSTFAWFSSQKDVKIGGLTGDVTSWDVAYYVREEERKDQTATFTIDQFYPGMDLYTDKVHIYNIGESSTNIEYELTFVKSNKKLSKKSTICPNCGAKIPATTGGKCEYCGTVVVIDAKEFVMSRKTCINQRME